MARQSCMRRPHRPSDVFLNPCGRAHPTRCTAPRSADDRCKIKVLRRLIERLCRLCSDARVWYSDSNISPPESAAAVSWDRCKSTPSTRRWLWVAPSPEPDPSLSSGWQLPVHCASQSTPAPPQRLDSIRCRDQHQPQHRAKAGWHAVVFQPRDCLACDDFHRHGRQFKHAVGDRGFEHAGE